ncbi:hypothetical protein ZHAS_00017823 [Anopheles sinensis]|uniref:Cytochrome P450 n=1 Tax=Anopheles sinensis TaxID=74873 RepID=A0A084WHW1_ANOSI|nr:hypothetical protein ZHAS_00017823 [Anopheles sinensis]
MELNPLYVIAFVSALLALYLYLTKNNGFFKNHPIPCLPVEPLFGSSRRLVLKRTSFQDFVRACYDRFPHAKIYGMFEMLTPMFVVRDAELVKRVLVKDFDHFVNHRPMFPSNDDPKSTMLLPKTLFVLKDQRWRNMRTTLSPTFTGSKMRQMFELIVECSERMVQHYRREAETTGPQEYELKDVFIRFTNDAIASCAFGVQVDSFQDENNVFFRYGKELTNFARPHVFLKMMGYQVFPALMGRLQIDFFDSKHSQFFTDLFHQSVETREKHGIVRPDMVHLLMQARKGTLQREMEREAHESFATAYESESLHNTEVPSGMLNETAMVAQCIIFFVAGFDAVANAMTFVAYELAVAQAIQQKLYDEILATHEALDGKSVTYDALQKMHYLDMVVSETLRKWPPNPASDRMCTKEYKIVGEDGEPDVTIPQGASVSIPIAGLHYDPRYYPEPERFDPERFNEENKHKIPQGAYLPFGLGPRNCIASRFALMEVKAIVYHLLLNFKFEPTDRTPIPMRLAKGFTTLRAEKGMHMKLIPRM